MVQVRAMTAEMISPTTTASTCPVGLLCGLECVRRGADVLLYGPETGAETRLDFARTLGTRIGDPVGPREPADH